LAVDRGEKADIRVGNGRDVLGSVVVPVLVGECDLELVAEFVQLVSCVAQAFLVC
jgi:hypothetical protein